MVLLISRSTCTVKVYGDLHPEKLPEVKNQLLQCIRKYGCAHLNLEEVVYLGYGTLEFINRWINEMLAEGICIDITGIECEKQNPARQ